MHKKVMYIDGSEIPSAVRYIYRKSDHHKEQLNSNKTLRIANVTIIPHSTQMFIDKKKIDLTAMEFNLLSYLVKNNGRAVSRDELLRKIWGFENIVETRATDDMIKRIRRKLVCAGVELKILSVRGIGYKIELGSDG